MLAGLIVILIFEVMLGANPETKIKAGKTEDASGNESRDEIMLKTGWVNKDGLYYYLIGNGEYATNQMIDKYYMDSNGVMVTDQWIDTKIGRRYFADDGKLCELCFQEIDGVMNYFNADGEIDNSPGLKKQGKDWYYFCEDGSLLKSQWMDELYFNEEGKLVLYDMLFDSPMGIQYYDSDGIACAGCVVNIDDQLYCFDTLGLMDISSGWKKSEEEWYYINEDGEFVRNNWVEGYYINPDGIVIADQYIDRFYIGTDGRWGGIFTKKDWKVEEDWTVEDGNWFVTVGDKKQEIDFSRVRSIARCGYDYENPNTPPEQSRASYEMAKEKGFDILLCDLRFTSDGIPVCYHYGSINTVARNIDGSKIEDELSVEELTYRKLNEYDWGIYKGTEYAGTKLMTFREMLSLMEELDVEVYVEIKTGSKKHIMEAVEMSKQYDLKISWAGSTLEQCKAVVKADPSARVATMPRNITDEEIENLLELKTGENAVFFFAFETAILTDETLEKLKNYRIPFEMGTINTIEEMVNYWTGNYNYCTGIESNWIVASEIDLNEYFKDNCKER